ncbi:MAG TPA: ORF6N domain-containing protein [Thermodesulfobacteriota bacterium]|nr:ORF6N domain-containing protein [Thermodesulfobacteriota bacterium]
MKDVIPHERIESRILELRGKKVIFDVDLAELYGTETKYLKRQVNRNPERFPEDFMFQLTRDEWNNLRSHFGTSSWGGTRYPPYAFTEHGILMLSNVLKSERAVSVSIQIIRVFAKMREMVQGYRELIERIQKIERRQDTESREVWKAIKLLQSTVMK